VDWYLLAGGAYYGAKKACEPLHVQYSYDDNSIWVVNGLYQEFDELKVTARVLNFDMTEKLLETAIVSVEEYGKSHALDIKWPRGLSRSHFLVLTLENSGGTVVSDNLYWLSTVPDVEGTKGYTRDRQFYVRPKSVADHRGLMKLPKVQLEMDYQIRDERDEKVAHVEVKNPSDSLAFFVHLAVTQGEDGAEVAPTYWSDNYFSLLPGQSKLVRGVFAEEDLQGAAAVVKMDGWNVK
jgi:exo-1,4-beta-D-glucosaminidase